MKELNIRISKMTEEEKKKAPNYEYRITFVGGTKLCEHCVDKMDCLTGTDKCTAYKMDGKIVIAGTTCQLSRIVNWAKELCGEL